MCVDHVGAVGQEGVTVGEENKTFRHEMDPQQVERQKSSQGASLFYP